MAGLIPPSADIDNCTTRIMKTITAEGQSITDGISILESGFISDLIAPVEDSDIATKEYVDDHPGPGPFGINTSVQISNGAGGFTSNGNLLFNGTTLTNSAPGASLTNGDLTITAGKISGLANPVEDSQASNKQYVTITTNSLSPTEVETFYGVSYLYTPAVLVNNIIIRTYIPNTFANIFNADILPNASEVIEYLTEQNLNPTVGMSFRTIIRIPVAVVPGFRFLAGSANNSYKIYPQGNFLLGVVGGIITTLESTNLTMTSIITNVTQGSEEIVMYLTQNTYSMAQEAAVTSNGLLTPSFSFTQDLSANPGMIIMPVNPLTVSNAGAVTYTYSDLQRQLIVRTGLIGATTDTFENIATFALNFQMGFPSTIRFFIQNTSAAFNLQLNPGTGWRYATYYTTPFVIPPLSCGGFLAEINTSFIPECVLSIISLASLNG